MSCRRRWRHETREMQEALPAAHVVTRHQAQPGRAGRNKVVAGLGHKSALQPHVYGIADQPYGVQLAVTVAYGKGGDVGRREHDRVPIGRVAIYH
jgi:hypothetical protein